MLLHFVAQFFALLLVHGGAAYDNNFDLNLAKRYVDFCGVAYCTDPIFTANTVDSWTCNACKKYPGVVATSFHGGDKKDGNGFVAYDSVADEIIVSFSGTDPLSIENWIDDLDFFKTSYPYCQNCEVHEGFYKTFLTVKDQVKDLVDSYMKQHANASIAITGHSLGAALSVLSAAEFVHNGYKIKTVYNFGLPRVGESNFEQWYINGDPGTFRVVHRKDPVPHLPPQNWNFHHIPYEVCAAWACASLLLLSLLLFY
jgi:hypothetical protein